MGWKELSWYHSSPLTDSPAVKGDKGHFPLRCKLFRPWSTSHRVWKPVWGRPCSPTGNYFGILQTHTVLDTYINLNNKVYFLKWSTSLPLKQAFSFIFILYLCISQQNTTYAYFPREKWQANCSSVKWCTIYALNYNWFQFDPFCLGESLRMDETSLTSVEYFRDLPHNFDRAQHIWQALLQRGSGL